MNTLYPNINDLPAPLPNLLQSPPAQLTTHDKTNFPRTPTPLFSSISAGIPLAQMIPQTQLQSHQHQIIAFKPPIPPKTTTVKPSTVNSQAKLTIIPILQTKNANTTCSLTANFTQVSHSNSSHLDAFPQTNTMYPSRHQGTISSNDTPPLSMATQTPLYTTSNPPVQTHILVRSFQPCTLFVPTCAPFSSQLQISDGTDYSHRPNQLFNGIKARMFYQLDPKPTNPDQNYF